MHDAGVAAASLSLTVLLLTVLLLTVVQGSRVTVSALQTRSESHVVIKKVCVTCSVALPRNPLSSDVRRGFCGQVLSSRCRCLLQPCLGSTSIVFEIVVASPCLVASHTPPHLHCLILRSKVALVCLRRSPTLFSRILPFHLEQAESIQFWSGGGVTTSQNIKLIWGLSGRCVTTLPNSELVWVWRGGYCHPTGFRLGRGRCSSPPDSKLVWSLGRSP